MIHDNLYPDTGPYRNTGGSLARYAAFFLAALALAGCAGVKFPVPPDPLVLLGEGGALYAAFPVAPNRALLDAAMATVPGLSDKDRDSWASLVDRTETARLALFEDASVRIVLTGNFPKAAEPLVFPASKGWTRVRDASGFYWHENGSIAAAIPATDIVCVVISGSERKNEAVVSKPQNAAGKSMQEMLSRAISEAPYPLVSAAFTARSAHLMAGDDIALYLAVPNAVLPSLFGADFSLPVDSGECIARPESGSLTYALSFTLVAPDERRARAMATIVKIMAGTEPRIEGTAVNFAIKGVSVETLAGFTDFLIF